MGDVNLTRVLDRSMDLWLGRYFLNLPVGFVRVKILYQTALDYLSERATLCTNFGTTPILEILNKKKLTHP